MRFVPFGIINTILLAFPKQYHHKLAGFINLLVPNDDDDEVYS
jgi:hypothetical protein